MKKTMRLTTTALLAGMLALTGCATKVTEVPSDITRSAVPFSTYKEVILVTAKTNEKTETGSDNTRALAKINSLLKAELGGIFKNMTTVTPSELDKMSFTDHAAGEVLLIKPYIKQMKFVGGGSRVFLGAMAGSSVVIMDTAFEDAVSKQQLSNPGYYKKASAYGDAFGIGSNQMLNDIVFDVKGYVRSNL